MSDREAIERQKRRMLRGRLLRTAKLLYGQTPDTVGLDTFKHVAGRHEFHENDVLEELAYLTDLGYLERKAIKLDALDRDPRTVWRLTAIGVQVLNGDRQDDTIEL